MQLTFVRLTYIHSLHILNAQQHQQNFLANRKDKFLFAHLECKTRKLLNKSRENIWQSWNIFIFLLDRERLGLQACDYSLFRQLRWWLTIKLIDGYYVFFARRVSLEHTTGERHIRFWAKEKYRPILSWTTQMYTLFIINKLE